MVSEQFWNKEVSKHFCIPFGKFSQKKSQYYLPKMKLGIKNDSNMLNLKAKFIFFYFESKIHFLVKFRLKDQKLYI